MCQTATKTSKSKGKLSRNWGHSATSKCKRTQTRRNLNQNPSEAKVRGHTPTETARAPKRPRDSSEQGTYKEALTNIRIAIFRETYPEDKLNEEDQNYILEELGRVLRRTSTGELPHLKSYRLEGGHLSVYVPTNSLDNGLLKLLTITGWEQGPG
jgi:hypothetical protein